MHISTTPHRQLQQRVARNHVGPILLLLDTIVEPVYVLENTIPRIHIVAIIQIILERIIGRTADQRLQHHLRDRDVDRRPDRVGHIDVIAILRLAQNAVAIRLVVARAHHRPFPLVRVVGTLDNRVIIHLLPRRIHWDILLVERNLDDVGIGIPRRGRLEHRRNTASRICQLQELLREFRRDILTRQRLAWIQNVHAWRPPNIQRPALHHLLAVDIVDGCLLELHEEINGVLVRRLPLVHPHPHLALNISGWRHPR